MPLAQHHGIPTRLLDWTFRPTVAAYFAAYESQVHRCNPDYSEPEFMVVWAVRWKEVGKVRLFPVMHQRSLKSVIFKRRKEYSCSTSTPMAAVNILVAGNALKRHCQVW